MIIDLDRIEEETFIDDVNGIRKDDRKNSREMMRQWN